MRGLRSQDGFWVGYELGGYDRHPWVNPGVQTSLSTAWFLVGGCWYRWEGNAGATVEQSLRALPMATIAAWMDFYQFNLKKEAP